MERLTEYEWEQRGEEREQTLRFVMRSGRRALEDEAAGWEVEFEVRDGKAWAAVEEQYLADGWELAEYGRVTSMFMVEGYFRRRQREQTVDYQI